MDGNWGRGGVLGCACGEYALCVSTSPPLSHMDSKLWTGHVGEGNVEGSGGGSDATFMWGVVQGKGCGGASADGYLVTGY